MSLRSIHIIFIAASIIMTVIVMVWSLMMFSSGRGGAGHIVFAVGCLVSALLMTLYALKFVRKTKEIGIK
tara:strand:- start:86 stop:295 length:210 start_codon:yes stop_codon:yes gene_type:complete